MRKLLITAAYAWLAFCIYCTVPAVAQSNSRPCSAQSAAMQPTKPTLEQRVADLERRLARLEELQANQLPCSFSHK